MNRTGFSKSGLFLLELMLVILFFAISAAVCLQMFAYASLTAKNAENLSYATLAARGAAQCYQATQGDLDQVADLLEADASQGMLCVDYDAQWQVSQGEACYQLTLTQRGATADIVVAAVVDDATPIYTLSASVPEGVLP